MLGDKDPRIVFGIALPIFVIVIVALFSVARPLLPVNELLGRPALLDGLATRHSEEMHQKVTIPHDPAFNVGLRKSWAVSFWYKRDAREFTAYVTKGSGGVGTNPRWFIHTPNPEDDDKILLSLGERDYHHHFDLGAHPVDGAYHHVVVNVDRESQIAEMFVDGGSNGPVDISAANDIDPDSIEPILLGSQNNGRSGYIGNLDGAMKEFVLWTRTLDKDEIAALYNEGRGLPYPFDGTGS